MVNSLLKNWQGRIKFVDDTSAHEIIPRCSPSLLSIVANEISDFAVSRGMNLNPKKCKEMFASFLKYDLQCIDSIYISGTPVERVCCYKLLGVIISQDLTWNRHVDYILKKANSRLYSLRQLRKAGLTQHDLLKMYCSLVRSCIEYASPVWSDLIESVQKRALRIILPSLAYEDALTRSGLETLASRRSNACQMFVEKMKSDDQPNNPIANILRQNIHNEREHSYNLRHEGLNRVRARTERFS
jgi:hypothetical protein